MDFQAPQVHKDHKAPAVAMVHKDRKDHKVLQASGHKVRKDHKVCLVHKALKVQLVT